MAEPTPEPPSDPIPESPSVLLARLALRQTLRLRKGESVIIETWPHMLEWAREFVVEARRIGARPMVLYEDEPAFWRSIESFDAKRMGEPSASEWAALSKANGYVFLWGPEDRPRLMRLGDAKVDAIQAYNGKWYEAAKRAHLRGVRIQIARASPVEAKMHGVDVNAWREQLLRASLVPPADLKREAARLVPRLAKGRTLTLRHANGTNLTLGLARRTPAVDDAMVDERDLRAGANVVTLPGGAVTVALDEKVAEGLLVANRTSFLSGGPAIGGRWTFSGGKLTAYEYATGGELFSSRYEAGPKGRDQPGFFTIGLNPELRNSPGLEDQERGGALLAIGDNSSWGGKTKNGFASWLVLGGAHIGIDGKPVVEDGEVL